MEESVMYTYKAKVIKVIDGDTVDCEIDLGFHINITKRVRLSGIDAFELNSKDLEAREKAAKAKSKLTFTLTNKYVILVTELDKADKYGRVLGSIYESEKEFETNNSINLKLIQEGLAIPYDGGKKNV
jgi:micrococcal nuclease